MVEEVIDCIHGTPINEGCAECDDDEFLCETCGNTMSRACDGWADCERMDCTSFPIPLGADIRGLWVK